MEQQAAQQARIDAQTSRVNSEAKELEALEAYRPNSASADLFEASGRSTEAYYSLSDIRALLADYIKEKQLAEPKNQRMIRLDDVLRSALSKKGEQLDRVPRDQTSDR